MTSLNSVSLGGGSVNPTPSGVELANSRRLLYVEDVSAARVSYGSGGLGACAIGVNYSTDGGATWQQLVEPGPTLGASGTVLASQWVDVRGIAWSADVLVAAFAYGATLLNLGVYSVTFVDLQTR